MPGERIQRRIDALLDEIEAAEAADDWAAVRAAAQKVLDLDPQNVDAGAFLAAMDRREQRSAGAPAGAAPAATPSSSLPSSFASGRYRVVRLLGEGGRKRVFLAHDDRLDRDVAFCSIRTDGLDALGRQRILREAQAMARLGPHPNLVTIHDVGEDGGTPFIVEEFMAGGDVAGLLRSAAPDGTQNSSEDLGTGRLPLVRTLAIAADVCRGLSFIHSRGLVHRDLKPANVFLTADGTAKLGDFGLAVSLDRTRLTQHGVMLGTVAYMPPEQALGAEVTSRADLYALGAMLYELVTGRPPFPGDDPTAVISQHISVPPVAPSWLTERCPPPLEDLILALLEKQPARRPADAAEVLAALANVDPAEKSAGHSSANALERLSRGVFVGREKELERLHTAFDDTLAGRGRVVTVVGEPGIGKTRVTQELETYARMRGATVLWGRTHESSGAPPYWPWIQAADQWATLDEAGYGGLHVPPDVVAELSRILPDLRHLPGFVEPRNEPDPQVAQFRLFASFATFLRAVAERAPLVIALDDLHWADPPTLLLLQHIGREVDRSRILIVANYRDTDITRQSALSETLAVLNRESGLVRIVLRGLSREEVRSYIRAKAHVDPGRELLDRIYEETEGNAFFLSEVVNLLAQEGTLDKDSVSDIAIPDGVREAMGRRLNRLSQEANDLLQTSAVIGREFAYDVLLAMSGADEDRLLALLEEGLEARVIEEPGRPGQYRFTHAQVQETLLAELSTTRRVRLHGQVGEALERLLGQRADEVPARLARHFIEAATLAPRFLERAVHYSELAGQKAMSQAAFADAARHYQAAVTALEGRELDEPTAVLYLELGRAQRATLDLAAAWANVRRAFEFFASAGDSRRIAELATLVGSAEMALILAPAEQLLLLERALLLVTPGGPDELAVQAAIGYLTGARGDVERADAAFAAAAAILDRHPDTEAELNLLLGRGTVDALFLRWDAALASLTRLAQKAPGAGREADAALAHYMIASVHHFQGESTAAAAHLQEAARHAESTGVSSAVMLAAYGLSGLSTSEGRWEDAMRHLERGFRAAPGEPRLLSVKAIVELETGQFEAARGTIERLCTTVGGGATTARQVAVVGVAAHAARVGLSDEWLEDVVELARSTASGVGPMVQGAAGMVVGLLAALRRDPELAALAREELRPLGGRPLGVGFPVTPAHVTGLLSLEFGDVESAVPELESALAHARRNGLTVSEAHAAYDLARAHFARQTPADDARARELVDEALAITRRLGMKPLLEMLVALKVRAQGVAAGSIESSVDRVSRAVQAERPDLSHETAPDGTVTLMFTDIENSTALTEQLGDHRWLEMLRRHNAVVEEQVRSHGGKVVKNRGDGYMLTFARPDRGLDCALAIQRALAGHAVIRVRIGLHAGNPMREGEDFFGTDVNLAARVADRALGGQVLVSERLHRLVAEEWSNRFGEAVEVELRGLSGTHRVFEAIPA